MTSVADLRVLIVDDSEPMRQVLRSLLRAVGMRNIAEAADTEEALILLRLGNVDLVLLDWKMTPIDGLAFTRQLRLSPESPNPFVPIVMLTAHTEASRVAAARDAGVSGFLRKPISARTLLDRIANALTDPRLFVRSESFFGPDRRRGQEPNYAGPLRRADDNAAPRAETVDIDDTRLRA